MSAFRSDLDILAPIRFPSALMGSAAKLDGHVILDDEVDPFDIAHSHLTDHTVTGNLKPAADDALKNAVAPRVDPMRNHPSIVG